jgi:Beta-lactamase
MSQGGLSKARLSRMQDVMAGYVVRGEVPGIVTLVARRGEVHVEAIGMKTIGGSESGRNGPMRRDTIFRITSMTKPVTAAAAMILVEECKLRLDEPVDRLLPELADRKVLQRIDGPLDDTVPAHRPITVRDLLTFRMDFGLILGPQDQYPVLKAASEQGIMVGPPKPPTLHAPDEWMRRFGTLPLMHQPGEKWLYNTGSDVLGVRSSCAPLVRGLRPSCANASSSRSACRTPTSACRLRSSTGWRAVTSSIPQAARSNSTMASKTANGAARPSSRLAATGWSRPLMTIWPLVR